MNLLIGAWALSIVVLVCAFVLHVVWHITRPSICGPTRTTFLLVCALMLDLAVGVSALIVAIVTGVVR